MAKYTLKEGVVLKPYGEDSLIDNSNITDAIAEMLIAKGRAKKEDFKPIVTITKKHKKNGNSK